MQVGHTLLWLCRAHSTTRTALHSSAASRRAGWRRLWREGEGGAAVAEASEAECMEGGMRLLEDESSHTKRKDQTWFMDGPAIS